MAKSKSKEASGDKSKKKKRSKKPKQPACNESSFDKKQSVKQAKSSKKSHVPNRKKLVNYFTDTAAYLWQASPQAIEQEQC